MSGQFGTSNAAPPRATAAETLRGALPLVLDGTKRYFAEGAGVLEAHADLLVRRDPTTAAHLLGAAGELRRRSDRPVSPAMASIIGGAVAACTTALGAAGFDREHRRGGRLDRIGLLELCRRIAGLPVDARVGHAPPAA